MYAHVTIINKLLLLLYIIITNLYLYQYECFVCFRTSLIIIGMYTEENKRNAYKFL